MEKAHDDIDRRGANIAAVSMASPLSLDAYLREFPKYFPVYADPDQATYRALETGYTTWRRILSPRVVWGYLRLIARGGRVRRLPEGEDPLRMGGDFVIDPNRRVRWRHVGRSPIDRPPLARILQAIEESRIDV